ncbi:hypothetical protein P167DRAFT_161901 [Morchella conica CCBAS932]|uniref:Transmembrane protein n=1 Tax=Morchella conica CCBAS932 TaxID=1392247 RepID=A0A3N4KPS5_9PEZI|nr:hypothetical protein P167DRAFT_161901 [Morchella conica CCBAS932]
MGMTILCLWDCWAQLSLCDCRHDDSVPNWLVGWLASWVDIVGVWSLSSSEPLAGDWVFVLSLKRVDCFSGSLGCSIWGSCNLALWEIVSSVGFCIGVWLVGIWLVGFGLRGLAYVGFGLCGVWLVGFGSWGLVYSGCYHCAW